MSLRTWWESRAESTPTDYTSLRLAAAVDRVSGEQGARGTAAFIGCKNLIERAVSVAALEGEHADVLRVRLSEIARALADCGESTWEIRLGPNGLTLLPCKISAVTGGAEPASWHYSLTRSGPTENIVIERPAEAVLSFRVHSEPGSPWRGVAPLEATNGTGALLAELEAQLTAESKVLPTRIITGGGISLQAGEIERSVRRGGIVTLVQGSMLSRDDPSGVRAGVVKNETSASVVTLRAQLEAAVCAALGVPGGLILGGGDGAAAREDFRRFAAATVSPLLQTIAAEWEAKIAPLKFDLNALRASDETARARALGSRANAVSKLVASGVPLDEALSLSGVE